MGPMPDLYVLEKREKSLANIMCSKLGLLIIFAGWSWRWRWWWRTAASRWS